jgi:hypothetical protein
MTTRANATFDIDTFDDQPYDEQEGARLSRMRLTKTFHGDIEGHSSVEALTATASEGEGRAYVGLERIAARVHGSSGTFVVHHTAIASSDGQQGAWTVVPGSATGELRGLRGESQIMIEADGSHTFILDYDLA